MTATRKRILGRGDGGIWLRSPGRWEVSVTHSQTCGCDRCRRAKPGSQVRTRRLVLGTRSDAYRRLVALKAEVSELPVRPPPVDKRGRPSVRLRLANLIAGGGK